MIKVEVNWCKDGVAEFGFYDKESNDENYIEDVVEELAKILEIFINLYEKGKADCDKDWSNNIGY